jgi:hypothetical protein
LKRVMKIKTMNSEYQNHIPLIVLTMGVFLLTGITLANAQDDERIAKIKDSSRLYMSDGLVQRGVASLADSSADLSLNGKVILWNNYINLIKSYWDEKKPSLSTNRTFTDAVKNYDELEGYEFVWKNYPVAANKAWEEDHKRLNLTYWHVDDLIERHKADFINKQEAEIKSRIVSDKEYLKYSSQYNDISTAIQNLELEIGNTLQKETAEDAVKTHSNLKELGNNIKEYHKLWISNDIVHPYLDLVEVDLWKYNDLKNRGDFLKAKTIGHWITTFFDNHRRYADQRELVVRDISMINAVLIKAADTDAKMMYRKVFADVKESLDTPEFTDLQEAQKVYDSIDKEDK